MEPSPPCQEGSRHRIRPIGPGLSEAEQWIGLRRQLWPGCSAERHALEVEMLRRGDGVVVVAEWDGGLIGFAEVSIRRDHVEGTASSPVPYLEGWFVSPRYRGMGTGRALLAHAEAWARRRGFTEMASDAEIENEESISLHHRLGFREVGRTVSFVKRLGPG